MYYDTARAKGACLRAAPPTAPGRTSARPPPSARPRSGGGRPPEQAEERGGGGWGGRTPARRGSLHAAKCDRGVALLRACERASPTLGPSSRPHLCQPRLHALHMPVEAGGAPPPQHLDEEDLHGRGDAERGAGALRELDDERPRSGDEAAAKAGRDPPDKGGWGRGGGLAPPLRITGRGPRRGARGGAHFEKVSQRTTRPSVSTDRKEGGSPARSVPGSAAPASSAARGS